MSAVARRSNAIRAHLRLNSYSTDAGTTGQRHLATTRRESSRMSARTAGLGVFGEDRETLECIAPDEVELVPNRFESTGVETIDSPCSVFLSSDETCAFQDLEVLADSGPADRQRARDLYDRTGASAQDVDNLSAIGVAERGERNVEPPLVVLAVGHDSFGSSRVTVSRGLW